MARRPRAEGEKLDGAAEARRRIAEAARDGVRELDLSGLGLTALPPEIGQLTALLEAAERDTKPKTDGLWVAGNPLHPVLLELAEQEQPAATRDVLAALRGELVLRESPPDQADADPAPSCLRCRPGSQGSASSSMRRAPPISRRRRTLTARAIISGACGACTPICSTPWAT